MKMKAYFEKTNGNNIVIITDGDMAKIFNGAPDGKFEGVDLYAEDTVKKIKALFESAEMPDFSEMYSENEVDFSEIEEELEGSELIYEW